MNGLFSRKQDFPQIIDFIEDFLDSQHYDLYNFLIDAGWSSPVARWAHNPKVDGSNPSPATKHSYLAARKAAFFMHLGF